MKFFNKLTPLVTTLALVLSCGSMVVATAAQTQETTNITFTENFSQYNTENSAYGSDNKVIGIAGVTGTFKQQKVAENAVGTWYLSGKECGRTDESANTNKGFAYVASSYLAVDDGHNRSTTVNFKLKDAKLSKLNSFSFKASASESNKAMRFLVSEDEKTYYTIGQDRGNGYTTAGDGSGITAGKPFFVKFVNDAPVAESVQSAGDDWTKIVNVPSITDVTIDYETNTISWTMTAEGQTWTGSFIDEGLSDMLAAAYYPIAADACGDRTAEFKAVSFNADVVPAEGGKYAYYSTLEDAELTDEDYYGTVIEGGTVTTDVGNTMNATRLTGEAVATSAMSQPLFTDGEAAYVLSNRRIGAYSYDKIHAGGAGYYSRDAYADSLYVRDSWAWITAVNLDLGPKIYKEISGVTVQSTKASGADIGKSVRFLVSADESSYYELGVNRDAKKPYFSKVSAGTEADISPDDDTVKGFIGEALTSDESTGLITYEIDIDGNDIDYKITYGSKVWSGTYTDTAIPTYVGATRYPAAFTAKGDGYVLYKNVGVDYKAEKTPDFEEYFDYTTDSTTAIGEENKVTAIQGKAQQIISSAEYSWDLSGTWIGAPEEASKLGYVYVTTDGQLYLHDWWQRVTTMNLNMGNVTFTDLSRIQADSKGCGSRTGIRFMVSKDEKSYYEFGIGGNNDASTDTDNKINQWAPYFRKVANGTDELIGYVKRSEWDGAQNGQHTWSVEIEGNTLTAKVVSGEKTWEVTYEDANLAQMTANTAYPITFMVKGDEPANFDNVKLNYEAVQNEEPIFADDFSNYTAEDCPAYGDANYLLAAPNYPQLVAKNENAQWSLSGTKIGAAWAQKYGGAALNNAAKKLTIGDAYQSGTTVNMTPANPIYDMTKIKFTGVSAGDTRIGARFCVSGDELSYYEFAYYRGGDAQNQRTPYFVKYVNGAEVYREVAPVQWSTNITTEKDFIVTINGNKLIFYITSGAETWQTEYVDESIDEMMKNMAYPFAAYSFGDGKGTIDNLEIYGTLTKDVCEDNGDGTFTVNIQPRLYDVTSGSIDAVVVSNDENGQTIMDVQNVTDLDNVTTFTYDIPASGVYDVFLFDGAYEAGKALKLTDKTGYTVHNGVPENRTVIACIGDSLTEGHGSSNNYTRSYPGNLQRMLGAEYDVRNFGIGGRTLMESNAWYMNEQYYIDSQECAPDIVIIMLGTNDRHMSYSSEAIRKEFHDTYATMIETYQGLPKVPEMILAIPPISGTADDPNTSVKTYQAPIIKQLGQEYGCRVINIHDLITDYSLLYDALHFHDDGYVQLANHFYNAITKKADFAKDGTNLKVTPYTTLTGDLYAVSFNGDKFIDAKKFDAKYLDCNVENTLDISGLDTTDATEVKLMSWKNGTLTPVWNVLTNVETKVTADGANVSICGEGLAAGEVNTIEIVDADSETVFITQVASDADGAFYTRAQISDFETGNYSVFINGTAI